MRRFAGAALAFALGACAPQVPDRLPAAPLPHTDAIRIVAEPVAETEPGFTSICTDSYALSRSAPVMRCDRWRNAGRLRLTSEQTSRLHGLSDLKVWPDGRLLAVGDQGDLLEGRLTFDAKGFLTGVANATLKPVIGEDGQPITSHGDREYDAEGIAEFPNGDRLISLEQYDRILFYPRGETRPRPAPMPGISIVFNKGMEALAAYPEARPDSYLVGIEGTGEVFLCRVAGTCTGRGRIDLEGLELTSLAPLPDGRIAYLLRTYNPLSGNRVIIKVMGADGREVDRLQIARPQVVDNFEGLAAVTRPNGVRFFLISDDNFSSSQQTLLFAIDWTPPAGR